MRPEVEAVLHDAGVETKAGEGRCDNRLNSILAI